MEEDKNAGPNFIRTMVQEDMNSGKWDGRLVTRFPPEPNGYLHIGHAKSICLNFGLAEEFKSGVCHLRFDDTNPEKEEEHYIHAIKKDVRWLGFDWDENLFYASDYFNQLYTWAEQLIKKEKAFVCDLTPEEIRNYRGTLTEPGKESPYRNRSVDENLELFKQMKEGKFKDGQKSLRAKIDMNSANINMRDPVIYRIKHHVHPRTGDKWCIYPMYDYTHPLSDSIEKITHSLCTLEFEDHRPLYDWFCKSLEIYHPQQTEFSRLNLEFTVMSKRKLLELVKTKKVQGWDDPRMPTLSGMRRRGYTPRSIRTFCESIGITKKDSSISMSTLEHAVRDDLNQTVPRRFGVLNPLRVVITNWDEKEVQEIEVSNHPFDESFGKRKVPFSREIYIDRDDFMEEAPKKFFRLKPEGNVRLKFAYVITCDEVIKSQNGEIIELRCRYHKDTFGGVTPEGMKKTKGIINWVSAQHAADVEVRLYDRLFLVPRPGGDEDLNPDSLKIIQAKVEPSVLKAKADEKFQFERLGYFRIDEDSSDGVPVLNRIITLRDTWSKIEKQFE